MIPGMGNPKQMAAMLRQMGVKVTEIDCDKVVVFKTDGSQLVVQPASVQAIEMQGQRQLQVSGEFNESAGGKDGEENGGKKEGAEEENNSEEDAKLVAQQAGVTLQQAKAALEKSGGDIAEAIMILEK